MNPTNLHSRTSRSRFRRGLSLIEASISVAISSMLLVAVAAAFTSSASAIEMNDQFFRASQSARITMNQILFAVRQADWIDKNTTSTQMNMTLPLNMVNGLAMPNESGRTYAYDAVNKRVTLVIFFADGTTSPTYELANNVTSFAFTGDLGLDYNQTTSVVHATVTMTVQAGSQQVTMSGAAAARRAIKY